LKIQSYICGEWFTGEDDGQEVFNAINGSSIGFVSSKGIDFKQVLEYGRQKGGKGLQQLTFHQRADSLKALAKYLSEQKEKLYEISAWTGATRTDSWVDIEGGTGTLFAYSSMAKKGLPDKTFMVEGEIEQLSKEGTFVGQHILVSKPGVAVHINAFNFPCWGMLEKLAPSIIAGMPVIIKPATVSSYLTEAMVREIIASEILPEGSIQLICGSVGDTFDHLNEQDVVTFTGSASTGQKLKSHPRIIRDSIPFNMEADSLNCCILGETVAEDAPEFDLFIKEIVREMTMKAGQKCTAIRRIIVPQAKTTSVINALNNRLSKIAIGDPAIEGVRMGALVGKDQVKDVWDNVRALGEECEIVYGGNEEFEIVGGDSISGAFFPPTLLYSGKPKNSEAPHAIEAFGPVSTVMPYDSLDEAMEISRLGKGSLAGSIFTADDNEAKQFIFGTAAYHGRMLIINDSCAKESTGHGSAMPSLVHGGPGRAGGGEELGGIRAIKHYMQRTALQGSPVTLAALTA
jgi:oxepin-CoA hydrolase / 3-oxo-5,6-dehydrosuberyl-CoA semialdehyde dehydrogenase